MDSNKWKTMGRVLGVPEEAALVHGLAFASALSELQLEPGRLALALFGFNLGIELMQLVVIAATFPWLLLLAPTRLYTPLRVGGALFAASAAIAWVAQRAFQQQTPVDAVMSSLAAHPLWLLGALAVTALLARIAARLGGNSPRGPLVSDVAVKL